MPKEAALPEDHISKQGELCFLSGKYTRAHSSEKKGRLDTFNFLPFDRQKGDEVVGLLYTLAQEHKASPAQIALAWLLSKPFVTSIITGVSNLSQLESNLTAVDITLTAEEIQRLETLTAPAALYPNWMANMPADPVINQALRR